VLGKVDTAAGGTIQQPVSSEVLNFTIITLAAVLSIIAQSFDFGQATNIYHIPVIFDYFNSSEGPHDAYHGTLQNYFSYFWLAVSWFATEENIQSLFLGIHLCHRIALLWLLYLIVCELTPRTRRIYIALLTVLLPLSALVIWRTPVGYSDILTSHLTHTDVVSSVILLSWWLVLKDRWYLASAALGFAFNLNPFISFWNVALVGVVFLRFELSSFVKGPIERIGVMSLIYIAAASPTIFWIVGSWSGFSSEASSIDLYEFWRSFFPYHHFVDVQFANAIKYLLIAFATFLSLLNLLQKANSRRVHILLTFLFGVIGITVFGAIAPWTPLRDIAFVTFPLRMDAFVIFILFISAVAHLSQDLSEELHSESRFSTPYSFLGFLGVLLGSIPIMIMSWAHELLSRIAETRLYILTAAALLLLFGMFLVPSQQTPFFGFSGLATKPLFLWGAICLSGFCVLLLSKAGRLDTGFALLIVSVSVAGGMSVLGLKINWEPIEKLPAASFGIALVISAAGLYLAADALDMHPWPKNAAVLLAMVGLVVSVVEHFSKASFLSISTLILMVAASVLPWPRLLTRMPQSAAKYAAILVLTALFAFIAGERLYRHGDRIVAGPNENWLAAQYWARENTAPDTMFLQSRDVGQNGFSVHSRRPLWVDFSMGAAVAWQPDYAEEWQGRREGTGELKTLSDWLAYALDNDISYLIVGKRLSRKARAQDLELKFENSQFAILEVTGDQLKRSEMHDDRGS